jgi:hypothetical protein
MRVAARRGPFVEHSTLVGCSILAIEGALGAAAPSAPAILASTLPVSLSEAL